MQITSVSASVTRPADTTAYASGDLVANSTTAGSVVPLTFTLNNTSATGQAILLRVRLAKTGTSTTNASFRLHLYQSTAPTCANGDNAAWSTDQAANYLGNIDVATSFAFTDGAAGFGSAAAGAEMRIRTASGKVLYGLLEARGSYTPVSGEIFTATLETLDSY